MAGLVNKMRNPGVVAAPAAQRQRRQRRPRRPAPAGGGGIAGGTGTAGNKKDVNEGVGTYGGTAGGIAIEDSPQVYVNALMTQGGLNAMNMDADSQAFLQNQFYQDLYNQYTTRQGLGNEALTFQDDLNKQLGIPIMDGGVPEKTGKARKKRPGEPDPAIAAQQAQAGANIMAAQGRNALLNRLPGQRNGGNRFDPMAPQQGRWSWWD